MNDRGRVPFALIGVLLVITSTTVVATTDVFSSREKPDIETAMDGANAAAMGELRGAADEAATDAAIAPVTDPADTPVGRALSDTEPFEDSLKLRIYLRASERLENVETNRGPITVTASLPDPAPTTADYRAAIERVEIERIGEDDAALRVSIAEVTISAKRNGRTVTTVERSPEFVVGNPVLQMHDRTERFEDRANAPVTKPGLGQRLTARLYPIAWARGYAQYGGAPIAKVLGTRHTELATNDALLAEQRAIFGEADPDGDRGVAAAGRRVATTDLVVGAGGEKEWVDAVLGEADDIRGEHSTGKPIGTWREAPPDPDVTVGVNGSADHAFADAVGVTGSDRIGEAVEEVHTVRARLRTSTSFTDYSRRGGGSPGIGWTPISRRTSESIDVDSSYGRGPSAVGWSTEESAAFEVTISRTTTQRWIKENESTTTQTVRERTYRIRIAAQAKTKSVQNVPDGRLDGSLRSATDRAVGRAISRAGGFEGAARAAAQGRPVRSSATATAEPAFERADLDADVRRLRERTRDVTVTIPAQVIGTGRANPSSRLRDELPDRQRLIIDADRSARQRSLRAAQLAYLDALDGELSKRESAVDDAGTGIGDALGEHLDSERIDGAIASHRSASDSTREPITDPAGELSFAVDTAPSYLTTRELSRDRIDVRGGGTTYPLATRTLNIFTSPHGQIARGIVDMIPLLRTKDVDLTTAAQTLAALEPGDPTYDRLEREVESASEHVRGELVDEMVDAGVSERESRSALRTDAPVAETALELTTDDMMERAAESASGPVSTDRLELRLKTRRDAVLKSSNARPRQEPTSQAQRQAREKYSKKLEDILAGGIEAGSERARKRALGKRLGKLPAGLPLAPIPGYWFATANVWYVEVTGQYERFAVRANRSDGTGAVTYLRDGRTATIDHRGETRRLGAAEQISVQTKTAVVVVVPPGSRGVGNTDGTMDQKSAGWKP